MDTYPYTLSGTLTVPSPSYTTLSQDLRYTLNPSRVVKVELDLQSPTLRHLCPVLEYQLQFLSKNFHLNLGYWGCPCCNTLWVEDDLSPSYGGIPWT